ncbi:hypothetical protein GBA52_010214 [Prunus armeniaca]|nr:hypothetical protein GBA52_010214 [Prunus armeniaca]
MGFHLTPFRVKRLSVPSWRLRVLEGYELLQQVLIDGLVPESAAFNKLISGFCKEKQYTRVSKLLHTLIAKNRVPDNYTYHEFSDISKETAYPLDYVAFYISLMKYVEIWVLWIVHFY